MPTHFFHPKLRVWNHRQTSSRKPDFAQFAGAHWRSLSGWFTRGRQTQEGGEFGLATSKRLRHSQANRTIRDRWIIQKSGFQSADHERNAKCLLPPASVTRSGTTLPLLTRSERCSELEEPVDYLKCVFSAFYREGHLFRWLQRGGPAGNFLSPRGPHGVIPVPVPVAPCRALQISPPCASPARHHY
jgi:hypothetical protein